MSPYVLGGLAVAMFGLGIWQHYSMFPYEYRASMATDLLKQYSGFIMLLAVIFAGVTGILMVHGGNPPSANAVMPEMPAMPNIANIMTPKNNSNASKSIFNLGGNHNNANKPANNVKKNNNIASSSFKTV